jgi:hypothetical protein
MEKFGEIIKHGILRKEGGASISSKSKREARARP